MAGKPLRRDTLLFDLHAVPKPQSERKTMYEGTRGRPVIPWLSPLLPSSAVASQEHEKSEQTPQPDVPTVSSGKAKFGGCEKESLGLAAYVALQKPSILAGTSSPVSVWGKNVIC